MEVLIAANAWKCNRCTNKRATPAPRPAQPEVTSVTEKSAFLSRGSLKILQWNADGIGTKVVELERCLREFDIDVVVLQESKLLEKNRTPQFQGYSAIRRDRHAEGGTGERRGGGLLTYVKEDIPFSAVELSEAPVGSLLERLCVEIRAGQEGRLRITNVYCPPIRGETAASAFNTCGLPASKRDIVLGDLNAHSPLWDRLQPSDNRGEAIEGWMMEKDFAVVNDGTPTRVNRGTGRGSAPDVSLVHQSQVDKVGWGCLECLGSDHLPILLEWECRVEVLKARVPSLRRSWGKADWEGYATSVERD
jgi:endonuclease/exonuclease/phosphatase family metal-dependent hydrolase